jgi:hypothetical protein
MQSLERSLIHHIPSSLPPSLPPSLPQAEIKRDAQYAFLDVECRRGMSLVREKLRGKGGREGGGEDVLVEGEGEGEEEVVKSLWWKRTGWRGRFL